MSAIIAYVYEIPKRAPVAAVLEDGRIIDLDPYDIEAALDLFKEPSSLPLKRAKRKSGGES